MTYPFAPAMNADGRWAQIGTTPLTHFQVLGERASGTNFIQAMIAKNLALTPTDCLGWKHGFPHMVAIPPACLVVIAVRAPQRWILSMHHRPWHAHPDLQSLPFSQFIRSPWRSIVDRRQHFPAHPELPDIDDEPLQLDRHPITGATFADLPTLRSAKLAALAGMVNRAPSLVITQMEPAIADPAGFLAWLASQAGLAPPPARLRLPKRRMGNRYRRAVPDLPQTPKEIPAEDRAFLAHALDPYLEHAFGYGDAPPAPIDLDPFRARSPHPDADTSPDA